MVGEGMRIVNYHCFSVDNSVSDKIVIAIKNGLNRTSFHIHMVMLMIIPNVFHKTPLMLDNWISDHLQNSEFCSLLLIVLFQNQCQ